MSWADNGASKDISPNRVRVISVFGGCSFWRAQKTSRQISHCSRNPGFGEFCGPRILIIPGFRNRDSDPSAYKHNFSHFIISKLQNFLRFLLKISDHRSEVAVLVGWLGFRSHQALGSLKCQNRSGTVVADIWQIRIFCKVIDSFHSFSYWFRLKN